jgi:hypothetical protein
MRRERRPGPFAWPANLEQEIRIMRALTMLLTSAVLAATATAPVRAQSATGAPDQRADVPTQTYDYTDYGRQPTPPGGVPGNAPFNNQIRKHTAPLSANGGK